MKLNLGSGRKRPEGYVNIDLHGADINCDIRQLPFNDLEADEILAVHVCEHFYLHEIGSVLEEWKRVLKPGGKLIVELPCLDKVLALFMNGSTANMTMWALYGDPATHKDGEPALHKWCYSRQHFRKILELAGFAEITEETPHYHQPTRDMRWVATK